MSISIDLGTGTHAGRNIMIVWLSEGFIAADGMHACSIYVSHSAVSGHIHRRWCMHQVLQTELVPSRSWGGCFRRPD